MFSLKLIDMRSVIGDDYLFIYTTQKKILSELSRGTLHLKSLNTF